MEWVDIEDTFPDGIGDYLVWEEKHSRISWAFLNSNEQWAFDNSYLKDVTHWMELPEPPKTKE